MFLGRLFRNISHRRDFDAFASFFTRAFYANTVGGGGRRVQFYKQILNWATKSKAVGFVAGGGGGTLLAVSIWGKATEDPDAALKKKIAEVIARADAMYDNHMYDALYELLTSAALASESAEILWRLARAAYEKGQKAQGDVERRKYAFEAFGRIERALELDDRSFAVHQWYAILLEAKSAYEGTKAKIRESYKIKEHLSKALDLNPRDATTWHILGVWFFTIAGLKWYERTAASALFATPPTATYQEALDCFLKAETISPNFYSQNLLYLGKTYKEMGDGNSAKRYLKSALEYVVVTRDDLAAHVEAEKLLKEIK